VPLALVLFVGDLFHPIHDLSVLLFLNCDVGHGRGWSGTVPVLLGGREPDHVAGADLLDWSAFALSPAASGGDNESLSERMGA
jgi:hypothetical protein